MKIKISFCTHDSARATESGKATNNLDLARILEFRKWDVEYLSGDKQFKPMRRFIEQGLPINKIVKNALENKKDKNNQIANELGAQYRQWIRLGGLPFRTYASIRRKGVSLVNTSQYIDACYVKIESYD